MMINSSTEHCTKHLARLRLGTKSSAALSDQDQKLQNAMYIGEMQKVHGDSVREAVDELLTDSDFFPSIKALKSQLWKAEHRLHGNKPKALLSNPSGRPEIPPIRQEIAVQIAMDIQANQGTKAGEIMAIIGRAMQERSGFDHDGRPITERTAA